jgi:TatD DNase family protein
MFYDAHNHLQDAWLAPHTAQIVRDLQQARVARVVVNGTCQADWADVAALARAHPVVLPSFGLHPWDVGNATPTWRDDLQRALDRTPGAAIGEIGLDRWILERARPDDPRLAGLRRAPIEEQLAAFTWQLELAAQRNLPASVHCLDAWGELHHSLRTARRPACGFLLHAYGGSAELAREFVPLGAYFSFNGSFLAERHAAKRTVFAGLPADRVLAETDAPAMPPPETHRPYPLPGLTDGTILNHPANVAAVTAALAVLRAMPLDLFAAQLETNFHRLFGSAPAAGTVDRTS